MDVPLQIATHPVMTQATPSSSKRRNAEKARIRESRRQTVAARWSAIGIQFVVAILIGYWAGTWLDEKFDQAPWFSMAGIFLGMTATLYDMVVLTRKSVRALNDDNSSDET